MGTWNFQVANQTGYLSNISCGPDGTLVYMFVLSSLVVITPPIFQDAPNYQRVR